MGITNVDDTADDDSAPTAAVAEHNDQALTAGQNAEVDGHLAAANQAMIHDLEQEVQDHPACLDDELAAAATVQDDDAAGEPVGREARWRHRQLVLFESDAELYDGAKAEGFNGKWTSELFKHLGRYAEGTIQRMLVDLSIYDIVADNGRPVRVSDPEKEILALVKSERHELARDVVVEGFVLWIRYEVAGTGYDAEMGKGLGGYLVDRCLDTFPATFRKWQQARKESTATALGLDIEQLVDRHGAHDQVDRLEADDRAQRREERVAGIWLRLNDREKQIVGRKLAGKTHNVIAEELGMTAKAVSRAWERIMQRERIRGWND